MKILILADSHGHHENLGKALRAEQNIDTVLFLGDGLSDIQCYTQQYKNILFYCVRGNCDRELSTPAEALTEFAGKLIFYTHGDGYNVKLTLQALKKAAKQRGAEMVLFAHTHIPFYEYDEGLYLFNPGSVSRSRMGKETYGLLTISQEGHPIFENKEVPA